MKIAIIIPARYESSRFPGKPLIDLLGKPMIIRVADICREVSDKWEVYIATDDDRIKETVLDFGYNVIMTGEALTGTDRIAEACKDIDADIILNVQGDEPLLNPLDIERILVAKLYNMDKVINGYCEIGENEDPDSVNIPKVIMTERGKLVYMSRKALPGFKDEKNKPPIYYKQVCIYAFTKQELELFRHFGRKSTLERSEDIEILRFLELDKEVLMVPTSGNSLAIDVPEDVEKVKEELNKRMKF